MYVPVVNAGTTEILLYPRTGLGILAQVVSLPAGVTEVEPTLATISSQTAAPSVPSRIESLDLSTLTEQEQTGIQSLRHRYDDSDLGCKSLG